MLFFGKRKKETPLDLGWLGTDMHSHLLPGIDDGSPDVEVSLELIRGLQAMGYKKLITTPHVLWELYANTPEKITAALALLRKAVQQAGITIEIEAAAEYYIDEYFESLLRNKTPLLTISGNKVLVEFSMITAPMELQQVLFEMQIQNYQPVIAHPERYAYLLNQKEFFDELKNAGCLFQANLLSFTGYYGKPVQELADYLAKKGYYNLAGTDLHHERHLSALKKLTASATFASLQASGILLNKEL
jgi:protein-tyrosine phosphatase